MSKRHVLFIAVGGLALGVFAFFLLNGFEGTRTSSENPSSTSGESEAKSLFRDLSRQDKDPAGDVKSLPASGVSDQKKKHSSKKSARLKRLESLSGMLGRAVLFGDREQFRLLLSRYRFGKKHVGPLLKLMDEGSTAQKVGALRIAALAGMKSAVKKIPGLLKSGTIPVKNEAVRALLTLEENLKDHQSLLFQILDTTTDDPLRSKLAIALSRIETPSARSRLREMAVFSEDRQTRKSAALSLSNLDPSSAEPLYREALEEEESNNVQRALISSLLSRYGSQIPESIARVFRSRKELRDELEEMKKEKEAARYRHSYSSQFFKTGNTKIPFDPSRYDRIGITVGFKEKENRKKKLKELATRLFGLAPLDRYRDFFYFRIADEFQQELEKDRVLLTAYDSTGSEMPPLEHNTLDSTVFLHYKEEGLYKDRYPGYTSGNEAYVTRLSLHHEFGHAFARLADEYSDPAASDRERVNLTPRDSESLKWRGLISQNILPAKRIRRIERVDGEDRGQYLIPSKECKMNNDSKDTRFCPVCQLDIIAHISALTGLPVPW